MAACGSELEQKEAKIVELEAQLNREKAASSEKDSTINGYMQMINEIRSNLALIDQSGADLASQYRNKEISADDPTVVERMQQMGELLEVNQKKIDRLNARLGRANGKVDELDKMIMSLSSELSTKNRKIYQLQQELENLDAAFKDLFAAYDSQYKTVEKQEKELNTAFYAFGTKKELVKNEVITNLGGVIGIGRTTEMKEDFNQDYFTEINIQEVSELTLNARRAKVVTTHPADSYAIVDNENHSAAKLKIKDAKKFWSVSKYLVVVVK